MLDHAEFERWRTAAAQAYRGAEIQADAGLHNWACFLAEQSAQLAMKAVLHGIGEGAWGHDLVKLSAAIASVTGEPLGGSAAASVLRLARHYIPARYPDAHPSGAPGAYYGEQDSVDALADVRSIFRLLDDLWSRLVRQASNVAETGEPDRGT